MPDGPAQPAMAPSAALSGRFRRWVPLLGTFFVGQGAVQLLNLVTGFLLLRWLPMEQYAQYSVAFGFQSTIGVLADLGIGGSVVALVGSRGANPQILGSYVKAARSLRQMSMAILLPIALLMFPLLMAKHGWPRSTQLFLLGSICANIFAQGFVSLYYPALLIRQRLLETYFAQSSAALIRLTVNFLLFITQSLNSVTSSWTGVGALAVNGLLYRRAIGPFLPEPATAVAERRREIISYVAPVLPGIIYSAFQPQITLFLIAFFGSGRSIAEVAALGRLGQVFVVFSMLNSVIIAPYFARVNPALLGRRYLQLLAIAVFFCTLISLAAFHFPRAILWVIGPQYAHLQKEVAWSVISWATSFIATLIWTMNSSRKWVYLRHTLLLVGSQLLLITLLAQRDLSTTLAVMQFSVYLSLGTVLVHALASLYGMWQEKKQLCVG